MQNSSPYLTVLSILFGLFVIFFFSENISLIYLCFVINTIAIFSLKGSFIIHNFWFLIASFLSKIVPNILLTLIFFLLLTPLAILSRIFKSRTKKIDSDKTQKSIFITQNKYFSKNSFKRAW